MDVALMVSHGSLSRFMRDICHGRLCFEKGGLQDNIAMTVGSCRSA